MSSLLLISDQKGDKDVSLVTGIASGISWIVCLTSRGGGSLSGGQNTAECLWTMYNNSLEAESWKALRAVASSSDEAVTEANVGRD